VTVPAGLEPSKHRQVTVPAGLEPSKHRQVTVPTVWNRQNTVT
jgi:hypothetical protein